MNVQEKLQKLDQLYSSQKLGEAEKCLLDWLEAAKEEQDLGERLTLQNELEGLYRVTGRAEEACGVSDSSLELIAEMGLSGTVHHGTTILNAATANRAAGHTDKALALYREAEEVYKGLGDFPHREYLFATLNNNISQVYQQKGDYGQAEKYLQEALSVIRGIPGGESETATTRSNLSLVLVKLGKLREAEDQIKEALEYYEGPSGKGDNHYSSALSAAGEVAYRTGKYKEAEAYYERALKASERVFGETPETECIRRNLELVKEKL